MKTSLERIIRFDLPRREKLILIKPPTALALYMIPSQEAPASSTSIKNYHRGDIELDRFVSDIRSQIIIFARLCVPYSWSRGKLHTGDENYLNESLIFSLLNIKT
jgi:hypothetical protein